MTARICVTGLGGRLGQVLEKEGLGPDAELVALARHRVPDVPTIVADISQADSLGDRLVGLDAVVHLAAYPFSDDRWEEIRPTNIDGLVFLLEAARRAAIRRFVFASSLAVLAGHWPDVQERFTTGGVCTREEKVAYLESLDYPRSDSLYGASKVFGETVCRQYSERHGLSCVCLRIGEVRPDDRPNPEDPAGRLKRCSHADFAAGVRAALERTRTPGFSVMTLISGHDPCPRPA